MGFSSALERFRRQAAATPVAPALVLSNGVEVSYAEIAAAADGLAAHLLAAGLPAGERVAVLAEDRVTVVAALLACLETGCAFVYLDPEIPSARLQAMVALVEPACCVLEPEWRELWEEIGASTGVIAASDLLPPSAPAAPAVTPRRQAGPDELCYIYFTSGSTGIPKAIAGRRKGVDHFVDWEIATFEVGPGTRVSQLTRPSFDAFLRDVLTPLASGGTVAVPGREDLADGAALAGWLDRAAVGLVHCVPTLLRQLLAAEPSPDAFGALRHVLLSGERLLPADILRWYGRFGERIRLVNLYGPTETTMVKLFHPVAPDDAARPSIPIGKPMPGARALVVDGQGNPCRPGAVGEIYIRTPYRTLGYWNRPDLTAAAFVANPVGNDPADVVYRTGDLGRLLPDGNLEFLGRRDQQVKVGGVRVELAEVEDRLRRCPGVADVAVIDREHPAGGSYLCAYVVGEGELSPSSLRAALARELPEPMLPTVFVRLAELPRTLSGKVDRRALPEPRPAAAGEVAEAPRTPVEEVVAGLYAELLGVEAVGVNESFFEIGGHSLLATQLLARMRETFAVEVPLGVVFDAPTVAGLAAAVSARQGMSMPPPPRRASPSSRSQSSRPPLSFAQQRLWFLDQLAAGSVAYNVGEAVVLRGRLDVGALAQTLTAVVCRHEALRTRFPVLDGEPWQAVDPPAAVALPIVDLGALAPAEQGDETARLRRQESRRRFDLIRGPLLAATVLRLAASEHELLLTVHHIVCDAWSIGLLVTETAAHYREIASGGPVHPLAPLPLQYTDYALWQREWLRGETLVRDLAYWRDHLAYPSPRLRLAVAGDLEDGRGRPAGRVARRLAASHVADLRRLSRGGATTLFMTVLAAFQLLLSRLSGELDVVVGSPIAGRRYAGFEGMIGLFLNTLALRTDLSGNPSFRQLLTRVRATALAAYAHQDLPFERLVEELNLPRELGRNPLFDVLINLVNTPRFSLELPNLTLAAQEPEPAETKFGLTLTLVERGEELELHLLYPRQPLAAAYGEALLSQLEQLLAAVAAAPESPIDEISLITPDARALLPDPRLELSDPGYPPVHELFFAQAAERPELPAALRGGRAWTYSELAGRARELAARLAGMGVEPGTVVAVSGERDFGLLAALVAVPAAGGVLLPLDPELPAERRRLMLAAAGARHLLWIGSPPPLTAEQGWPAGLAAVAVAADSGIAAGPVAAGQARAAPRAVPGIGDAPAYIVFTSGSSGVPRAVLGRHGGLSHFVCWARQRYAVAPGDRCAQATSLAVDVILRECFLALASGAALCLPEAPYDLDGATVIDWLERDAVTILNTVPSLLRAWLAAPPPALSLTALRLLLVVGEPFDGALAERWRRLYGRSATLVNLYGSTETNLVKCFYEVPADAGAGVQPAGFSLPESQLLALADGGGLCGIGEPGEIVVRSPFLSGGYLGEAGETARRFVPSATGKPGERVYLMGDRGRYRPDGALEVMGRRDDQVKIRGMRVEPAEVAAVLAAHPAVRDCAVVAGATAVGEVGLVAYVVPANGGAPPQALVPYLAGRLPAAAIPGRFVQLAALPRLPSGKLDRGGLPPPAAPLAPIAAEGAMAELTPVEEVVAATWSELLGGIAVGRDDNFFALGGHSLLATRVLSRIEKALGVRVALRALFEAPRLADFARRVAAARSATSGEAASARPSLRPEPRAGHPPLSLGQRRLWWMDRLHAGAPLFNLPSAVRLTGELAVNALARALGEVVRRHEVLRTVFVETEGGLGQVIGSAAPVALPHVDLSGLARGLRSGAVERLAAEGSRRPFDLARGPLLRAALLSLDRREHVLLLVIHHAVFDAWSQAILVHELAVLYAAFAENRPSPLPALPVQYADFAIWQRRLLSGQGLDSELAYWRRQLAGPLPRLRLPYSREKEAASGLAGARHRFALAPALQTGLRRLAREQGATLFMVLLAGFQTLLHRYCGEADLVVGTDVANRTEVETEGLIGFFANQLVLRTDLAGDPPAAELLARVREVVFAAHAHQELPFDRLVEELNPERGGGSAELFQVKLGLVNVPAARLAAQGLDLALLEVDNGIAQNELLLFMGEIGERLVGALQYRTELFSAAAVDRLRRHLETLWAAMVERPALRLSELPLLGEEERHQLLKEWNDAESASRQGAATVHGRFAAQAERTPRAVAMASEGQRWSYEEIDARANRLAHLLCHMGVGPEVRVALCAEASMDMVVGVLGILKSGGAYVPLDPKAPPARLAWQLADSRVALVLAGEGLQNLLPPQGPIVVPLGAGWEAGESASAPEEQAVEENLAYVIYTSGSTGRPKGVMVPHRGVVGYLEWACRQYGLSPGRGAILHTGLAFDLTVTSLLGPLLSGGTVTVAAGEAASGLARALAHGGGRDLVKLTPPHLPVLSAALTAELGKAWEGRLAGLVPMMVVGGEALPGASLGVWRRHAPELSVVNEYGPTEASVGCCAWMGPAGAIGEGEVPIGRPIAGARLVTVDAGLEPVAVGVEGELLIGGAGLARGYLGDPGRTAERFVPDPFGDEPGARLYRTGDRVRRGETGELTFVGRLDGQVKIRGHRVEPGEVEAALLRHPEVAEAAVVARMERGSNRLVAYVAGAGREPRTAELRELLSRSLPTPLLPSAYVAMAALPRTGSGKVDRRALAALPAPEPEVREDGYMAPRTPIEELLAGIWEEVLRLERVGITDSFFDLGGHSLLATQVLARVQESLGVEVGMHRLFERPTVAALAEEVAAHIAESTAGRSMPLPPPLVALPRVAGEGVPLSFAQERLWLLDQLEPGDLSYNLPLAVRIRGRFDAERLAASLTEVVRRHAVLRTRFAVVDERPVQVIGPAVRQALPQIALDGLPPAARRREAERLSRVVSWQPFDLAAGPLFRAVLLRLGAEEHVALLVQHHIVSDGWSATVLVRELGELMAALARGEPPRLPRLPVQYVDYAQRQRQWLAGEVLAREVAHWRRELEGAPDVLELPWDRARPVRRGMGRGWSGRQPVRLDGGLARRLRLLCRQEGVTLYMALLAAWATLLGRYSGADDLLVGSPVANRTQVETEGLIGFFVNLLVLRTDLSGDPSGAELLGRVRARALAAYAHQDLPFARLVAELRPQRSLARTPLFQVVLVLQNAPTAPLAMPGLSLEMVELEGGPARFDLTLALADTAGGIGGVLEYRRDLLDPPSAARLAGHFEALLSGLVGDPRCRLSQLPLLTAAEAAQLHVEWNDTAAAIPAGHTVLTLFAAQVERGPERLALAFADGDLTYGELDRQANRLAHYLLALGVGPEVLVGICLERSPAMVVALLAVLKAGGAYLPLDPGYPPARLGLMLRTAETSLLVTRRQLLAPPSQEGMQVVCLDAEAAAIAAQSDRDPRSPVLPQNLAYVIFTSGSQGLPKGVMVPHLGLVNLAQVETAAFGLGPEDRVLQLFSWSFDASFWDLLLAFGSGGCLCVASDEARLPGEALTRWMTSQAVTFATLPPSLLAALPADDLLALRTLVATGEACPAEVVSRWAPGRSFWNGYGPTETTVGATLGRCRPDGRPPDIGRPYPNLRIYLAGPALQAVPIGVPGEIYIGGVGVARGYHGRPDLTAERFVPDPWSRSGERLYRTGDLARHRPDGSLEFLGRCDEQVQIRGFRVEPGEVQAVLASHPEVSAAAVVARETPAGGKALVAYAAPRHLVAADLLAFLRQRLPAHLVPASLMLLDALPLNPSGKLDRQALPPPPPGRPELGVRYEAPRTAAEEHLAAIWSELLHVDRVGVHDNFFELGGDSILAIQMVARAHARGLRLASPQVFEQQTIAALAAVVVEAVLPAAEQGPVAGAVPLTPVQHWFFARHLDSPHHCNQSLLFEVGPGLSVASLPGAAAVISGHHDALRLRFMPAPDLGWRQVQPGGEEDGLAYSRLDLRALSHGRRNAVVEAVAAAAQASLDLVHGPLARALLLETSSGSALLLVAHHLVVDGVSWRILLDDLLRSCQGLPLPPKTTSFKRWAERLVKHARSAAAGAEIESWLRLPWERVRPLPVDLSQGDDVESAAATVSVALSAEETRDLLHSLREVHGSRLEEALLAALASAFAGIAGGLLPMELEGHGREPIFDDLDLARTVGWFTSAYPLLLDLDRLEGTAERLQAVRERLRSVPHHGLGFGLLRYLGDPLQQSRLAALPRPEVSFNYFGQVDAALSDGAPLRLSALSAGPSSAPSQRRSHLLAINCRLAGGRLQATWTYSTRRHRRGTVAALAAAFTAALRSLLPDAISANVALTPAAFPQARISQDELDRLLAGLVEPEDGGAA